jgi:lipopolysaccharide exporter
MTDQRHSLGTRTIRGMAWAYGAYGSGRLLVVVSTAILARLLTPRDFGVVALAIVATTFLEAAKDIGLGQALILAKPEEEEDRAQTVFAWSLLLGVALAVLTAALSPLISSFFHQPELRWLLSALGLNFILNALSGTHLSLARKHLNYRVRTASELAEVIVRGAVGIALALGGAGAWSLVLGTLAGSAAGATVLWRLVSFRPRLRLARTHLREMLSFGAGLTVSDLTGIVFYNTDYVFIGRVLGASSLGLYTIGFRIPELAILNVGQVAADVLFPAYSALDRSRLRDGYLTGVRYIAMLTVPLGVGLATLARPLILAVFGHKWTGSIPVARAIAGYTLFASLSISPGTVLKVSRNVRLLLVFSVPVTCVLVALLAIFTSHGILTVALITTGLQATIAPAQTIAVSRLLDLPLWDAVRELIPPTLAAVAMGLVLLGMLQLIHDPVTALVVGVPLGAAVYVATLWPLAKQHLRALRQFAFPR